MGDSAAFYTDRQTDRLGWEGGVFGEIFGFGPNVFRTKFWALNAHLGRQHFFVWRLDIQPIGTKHNDTRYIDTKHNDTEHNGTLTNNTQQKGLK